MFGADITSYTAGGSAIALLGVAIALIFRSIGQLRRDNIVCNRRLGILFKEATRHGWSIPQKFWDIGENGDDHD